MDKALNNLQWLICHKSNQTITILIKITWFDFKCLEKGWYAVKQNNQPTNPLAIIMHSKLN